MAEADTLILMERKEPGLAILTLNRPEQRNAINPAMAQRLDQLLGEIEEDASIRVAILTGAGGKAFCAGADLAVVAAGGVDDLMTASGGFAGFVRAKRTKPWIAAVDGFALAGGCELALACDLIVASRESAFGLPEVARGLIAAAGGAFRLPQTIPTKIALELILTAGRLSASRAVELGMVNRLADPGEALEEAIRLAEEIAGNAPLAIKESLAIVRRVAADRDEMFWHMSDIAMERLKQSADLVEGASAFVEKRKPVWAGR